VPIAHIRFSNATTTGTERLVPPEANPERGCLPSSSHPPNKDGTELDGTLSMGRDTSAINVGLDERRWFRRVSSATTGAVW
jgi:hypothetical protein